ncbi:MAG: hypothetical protein A3E87_00465 [Gammaproteobacteria bacterium RIFCSPHIGHO2_12_FULL_35_23]|nr:MAG: hypothetical protein A3E87_00465 [Gammaproteobacteria bacterium RIFCSPHIGHO2_12_FULL_35_23]
MYKHYKSTKKLKNKILLISGRDSEIGRTIACHFALENANVAFTRSLAKQLIEKSIRVNAVALGPVWTPLISAHFSEEEVAKFGKQIPLKISATC